MTDISVSLIGAKGLCEVGRKCIKKADHKGSCYPADEPKKDSK